MEDETPPGFGALEEGAEGQPEDEVKALLAELEEAQRQLAIVTEVPRRRRNRAAVATAPPSAATPRKRTKRAPRPAGC